jgi:5'-nucleotidase
MDEILKKVLDSVSSALSAPVCNTLTEWDCRSGLVRTDESAIGNWMADVLLHAYDEAMCVKSGETNRADAVLICGGTIRGDNVHGPGLPVYSEEEINNILNQLTLRRRNNFGGYHGNSSL